ncbi:MAG: Asp23/Gls24 family envelope stress response protein [Firmicutes bacterium]|nr:Asp23/Gls24 family envelope stress response protein [Bacillota bacterium]
MVSVKSYSSEQNQMGSIKYNDDVIKTIVGMALNEVEGVAGIDGKGAGGILGRKHFSHINKITVDENRVVIELSLVVNYGLDLREKAREVQQRVKDSLTGMTDLQIGAVNITVIGLEFPDKSTAKE